MCYFANLIKKVYNSHTDAIYSVYFKNRQKSEVTFTFQDRSLSNHFCCCHRVFFFFTFQQVPLIPFQLACKDLQSLCASHFIFYSSPLSFHSSHTHSPFLFPEYAGHTSTLRSLHGRSLLSYFLFPQIPEYLTSPPAFDHCLLHRQLYPKHLT